MPKKIFIPTDASKFTDSKDIGRNIAELRKSKGLTQAELANLVGIQRRLISDYEIGRVGISAEMLVRFCSVLKVSSDELLGLKKQPPNTQGISLRFIKRLLIIETFPEVQKKRILRNLDDAIEAYKK